MFSLKASRNEVLRHVGQGKRRGWQGETAFLKSHHGHRPPFRSWGSFGESNEICCVV